MDTDDKLLAAMSVGVVLFIAVLIWFAVLCAATERRCLAAGYPHSNVTPWIERYCIKRVNQTDVVLPLTEAERK